MTAVFEDLDVLAAAAPLELGASGWVAVDAGAVTDFGRAVGAGGATDGDVPPLLLLSLTNRLLPELLQVPGAASGVNYGAEQVRFGPAVPIGARVRASATLVDCRPVSGGVQTEVELRVEAEGAGAGPAVTVRSLSRWLR